jgi:hypothetical protein
MTVVEQRRGERVGAAVPGHLHLLVGQPRPALDQGPHEPPALELALAIENQLDRDAGAILVRLQRAEAVGERLRQHRDDAVGKIDRVAALQRLAVERVARLDVVGHVGDRDDGAKATIRQGLRIGPDRIVEIAGVGTVDGHEIEVAEIDPVTQRRLFAPSRPPPGLPG